MQLFFFLMPSTAEAQLSQLDNAPGYPLMLLKLVSEASVDPVTRQGAAVTFKNFVRKHWVRVSGQWRDARSSLERHLQTNEAEVSADDRAAVKTYIVSLLLSAPPLLQKQLSDALSIIRFVARLHTFCSESYALYRSGADFPAKWPTLLPVRLRSVRGKSLTLLQEMLQKVSSGDFAIIKGVLATLHSIFKRYLLRYLQVA